MHDSIHMTHPNNLGDGPRHLRRRALAVMSPRHDPVKELPTLTQLHHEVHVLVVLVRCPELHNVGVVGEGVHDGHLATHVFDVDGGPKLPLWDGLAGELLLRLAVRAEVRDPELAAAQFAAQYVLVGDSGPVRAHRDHVFKDADRGRRVP